MMPTLGGLLAPGRDDPGSRTWATVTQASPLRIRIDGETDALSVTPDTLVAGLQVDDRVWVELAASGDPAFRARRVIVVGRAGSGWQTYTPTLTNITLGDGTLYGEYIDIDGLIFARAKLTLGSTTVISSDPRIGLPVTATDEGSGSAYFVDASTSALYPALARHGTTQFIPRTGASPSALLTATVPFTWDEGDIIRCSATYRRA